MTSENVWIVFGIAVLLLPPIYGYWIGGVSKNRSWSAGRLGQVLSIPIMIAVFTGIEAADIHQAPRRVRIAVVTGALAYSFLTGCYAASKSSGVPMMTLLSSRGDAGDGLKGKSDLSIR